MSHALRIAHGAFGRVALLDMDRPLVRHAHPHCHVLLKVEGNDTHFQVGRDLAPLRDETAVLINGWEQHAYMHAPAQPKTLILALYIEPRWLESFRPGWSASGAPGFFTRPCGEISPRIRRLALDLAQAMRRPGAVGEEERLLSDLMIALIERFAAWRSFAPGFALQPFPASDRRIRRVIDLMHHQPEHAIDTKSLAKVAGLSRAHFFRLFEATVKMSPHLYVNTLRMERAVAAIVRDDDNITAISETLGFSVPAHFTRFFRDHAGVPPREFRAVADLRA